MQNLELEEAAWILKEVRAIKREQRLNETSNYVTNKKNDQLELPLSVDSNKTKETTK